MQDISEIRSFSDKLINTIKTTPVTVNIVSNSWIKKVEKLIKIDFQLGASVDHIFFISEQTEELYIYWDYSKIDKDLKEFFKILIRVLKLSGTKIINVFDECFAVSNLSDNLVTIKDHINFTVDNPLTGKNFEEIGTRFPDMSHAYTVIESKLLKVVLAGVDDIDISEKTMGLIKLSEAEVYNFSVFWMNILAVHSSIEFSAVCKIK